MIEIVALILLIIIGYLWYFRPYSLRKHENKMTYAAVVITVVTILAAVIMLANTLLREFAHKVLPFID